MLKCCDIKNIQCPFSKNVFLSRVIHLVHKINANFTSNKLLFFSIWIGLIRLEPILNLNQFLNIVKLKLRSIHFRQFSYSRKRIFKETEELIGFQNNFLFIQKWNELVFLRLILFLNFLRSNLKFWVHQTESKNWLWLSINDVTH